MPVLTGLAVSEALVQDRPKATSLQEFLTRRLPAKYLTWDLAYLFVLAWLQLHFLPHILGASVIDLITPWIVAYIVFAPLNRSIVLALCASALLETHSLAPAGMYVCIYWVTSVALVSVKDTFSWSRRGPRISAFLAAELWLCTFEFLLIIIRGDFPQHQAIYTIYQVIRITIAVIFGTSLFTRESRLRELEAVDR